jgi:putative transposase
MKNGKEYRLPLEINKEYHNKDLIAKEFLLYSSTKKNKINISTTYEERSYHSNHSIKQLVWM